MKKIFLALVMLLTITLYGYGSDIISIRSNDDWNTFRAEVEKAKGQYEVDARLETDLTLNSGKDCIVGYSGNYAYRGTFDGNGHALNLNISDNAQRTGLFSHVLNATFRNLSMTGTVSSPQSQMGSLIGQIDKNSSVKIESCLSSVTLNSSVNGDATMGGFVGIVSSDAKVLFVNCKFDGQFTGNQCFANGGFVGWNNGTITIENCLFAPTALNTKFVHCRTWARGGGSLSVTNSYATREYSVFLISNTTDWDTFRSMIDAAKGEYYVDAMLTNDISIGNTAAMDSDAPWYGTFNGNGHTITADIYGDNSSCIALFKYAKNFTINNLNVKGTIRGGNYSAGLVGYATGVNGANTIHNCRVSAQISINSNSSRGSGFVGWGNVDVVNCRFDGEIDCPSPYTTGYVAAFVNTGEWGVECAVQSCLEKGTYSADHIVFNLRGYIISNPNGWGNDENQWSYNNWSYNNLGGAYSVGYKTASEMVSALGSGWELDGTIIVPKMTDSYSTNPWYNGTMTASEMVEILGEGNWEVVDGKAVPAMNTIWNYLLEGSTTGKLLTSGAYYVTKDLTFTNKEGESGLTVADGATVSIYIPKGVTLIAQGGHAKGKTGAGAGILVPQGSTLVLMGEGQVYATGGDAANGGNGDSGDDGGWNDSGNDQGPKGGNGGAGGDGGGGAGAGIGTRGADGGSGGSRTNTSRKGWTDSYGETGHSGSRGGSALPMGNLFIENTYDLDVKASGGSAGTRNGRGGSKGKDAFKHKTSSYNYSIAGGGGGGGGGFGGAACKIGTGGPGGGGGGSGAGGSIAENYLQFYKAGAKGGSGGYSASGSQAGNGDKSEMEDPYTAEKHNDLCGATYKKEGWYKGIEWWRDGGGGAEGGNASKDSSATAPYRVRYNVMDKFGGNVDESKSFSTGYLSNNEKAEIGFTIPTFDEVPGLIQQSRYLSKWNTQRDGKGSWKKPGETITIASGTTELYNEWTDYQELFAEGSGTKSDPFLIEESDLIGLADYVNDGGNTRGLYFRQRGDIVVKDILALNNRGANWTPIGHTYTFYGDYDGGGRLIRSAEIEPAEGAALGIFGKVAGAVHNLGVVDVTIKTSDTGARCGAIAGMLCTDDKDDGAGEIRHCYAANNSINAAYAGGLVGEMKGHTSMSHCHETNNRLSGAHSGGLCSLIHNNTKVDVCFTNVSAERMTSGEVTWLLNDKTAFGTTWYQNIDTEGYHNDYPVLDSISSPVYCDGKKYSNQPTGSIFALSGKGRSNDPFLIKSLADFEFVADFCNGGNKTTGMYFLQTEDFDLSGRGLTPVGSSEANAFDGNYDGGGHTIRNGQITPEGTFVGIFGVVTGTVNRLCVERTAFKAKNNDARVGGIAGRVTGNGEIANCLVNACKMSNGSYKGIAGGIVADMGGKALIRCCLTINDTLEGARVGYISSDMANGTMLKRCYTDGKGLVTPSSRYAHGTIENSFPSLDAASLGNGEIAYELNNSNDLNPEPAWYQNLNSGSQLDSIPVLTDSHAMVFKDSKGNYTNDRFDLSSLGKGTQEDPYKIGTPQDFLNLIRTIGVMKRSNFYVLQTADIDLKDSLLLPVGTCTDGFEGHYDGGGYVIKNVEMQPPSGSPEGERALGLFNNITGVVERLGIENSSFKADGPVNRVGAIAGRLSGNGVLRNCFVKGSTVDFNETPGVVVGALIGEQTGDARMENCYGYKNTVIGQSDGLKHYGYIVGNIGGNASASLVFTDGPTLCADKQSGAANIVKGEKGVTDFRFNAGEICWLLNGSKDNGSVWHQTMHKDSWPVPHAGHAPIYRYVDSDPQNPQTLYTNSNEVPYTVRLTLNPNDDALPTKKFEMFMASDKYMVPGFPLKSYTVERQDFYLAGWNTQQNGKGTFYAYDEEVLPTEESGLTLYAVWDIKIPAQMPANGKTKVVALEKLREDTVFYKVYADGGKDMPYSSNNNGKLTLKAPAGHCLSLTGTVATEAAGSDGKPRDYMTVTEKDEDNMVVKLTNEKGEDVFYSQTNGDKKDIGRIISSAEEITIEFVSDAENCYDGLDLLVTILPAGVQDLAGKGTEDSPFLVENATDLMTVNNFIHTTGDSKIYVQQIDDIDMQDVAFTPIAASVESFEGHYDGGGYAIRNLTIQPPSDSPEGERALGLFSNVSGIVERLGMVNCTISPSPSEEPVGGCIAGGLSGRGQVRNCYAIGNGVSFVGQDKVFTMGTAYTKEQFASGEVCYLLNGSKSENVVWRQTIGTDTVPVFTDNHQVVYRYQRNDKETYSNTMFTTPQYEISSREDFCNYIEKKGDIHLTQDIDVGIPHDYSLYGNFDGGGHTISYGSEQDCRGLFYQVSEGASIKHLRVKSNVRTTKDCGGIAYKNFGTISDCHINVFILGLENWIYKVPTIAGIAREIGDNGVIDHCSATGVLDLAGYDGRAYPITEMMSKATHCTWVDPINHSQYAAQRESALIAQADYPVYAKGILDAVGPEIVAGNNTIFTINNRLNSLTIVDGERFSCSGEVTVDKITYKRRGTNGAYEPWVLPFDYTIDATMLDGGAEFYRFEKDSEGNIVTKQINSGEIYQAAANEPLAFRKSGQDEYNFQMKLAKDGRLQSFTIKMPLDGVAASMASTKDIAHIKVTYDNIPAERTVKERMHVWDESKGDFTLTNGERGVTPFRYYLQYIDKATGNYLKYEQTDWARRQRNSGGSQQAPQRRAEQSTSLSTLTARGWQPIILDLRSTPTVTAEMLDNYEILCLSDIYEQQADDERYDVTAIYEPVEEDMTLPYAAPLLVRAKRTDVEPLVDGETGADIISLMREAMEEMDEEEVANAYTSLFEECHYWCSTFAARYDVWQMLLPESDKLLNEYGALVFANTPGNHHFCRVGAGNGFSMQPMSYCFTAYDAKTYENLPLANDRINIVAYGYTEQSEPTGIEEVSGKRTRGRGDAYNLQGQKVDDSYRGLIIRNGRKQLRK